MVEHVYPDDSTGVDEPLREPHIARRWRRIAGRMIVKHDDRRRPADRRLPKHVSWNGDGGVQAAFRDHMDSNEAVPRIEENRTEAFARMRPELRQQKRLGPRGPRASLRVAAMVEPQAATNARPRTPTPRSNSTTAAAR